MLRVSSPLTDVQEATVARVIDCAFAVHRALGPGFRERIYATAFRFELESRSLPFESEKAIEVRYRDWRIPGQRVDLVVAGFIVVEMKAIPRLTGLHRRQVLSYLRTMNLRIGLLINFNVEVLKHGLRRR
jgi:GxxExxY protein